MPKGTKVEKMYKILSKPKRIVKETPVVTVGAFGVLYLNKIVMENYFSGNNFVVLLFDYSKRKLAIQPAKAEDRNAYRLTFTSRSHSTGAVAARSVIKALKIDFSTTKQFPAIWNSKEKFLEVQL
jgi:hypothetical protein